jgi:hypothetical protein
MVISLHTASHADRLLTGAGLPVLDLLACVGFDRLLMDAGGGTPADDEDDAESIEEARLCDHDKVRAVLLGTPPKARTGYDGCHWLPGRTITWPDRVPGLKTWGGNATLCGIIKDHQTRIGTADGRDLFELRGVLLGKPPAKKRPMPPGGVLGGPSGLDAANCPSSIDAGFSISDLEMDVACRPAVELLAIVGLESLPLVSVSRRVCGFVYGRRLWVWETEVRAGHHYRWAHFARPHSWESVYGDAENELSDA